MIGGCIIDHLSLNYYRKHPGLYLLTYLLRGAESFLRSYPVFSQSRNSPHFREQEGSLPHSQVPATSHFLKIHLYIILPSTPGSPKCSISLRFPHQNPVHNSLLTHTRYMPRPSHFSRFYHPQHIVWEIKIIKLLIMQFSPLCCYLVPLTFRFVLTLINVG